MTQPAASHIETTTDLATVSAKSEDVIRCSWGLYVSLRGFSGGLIIDADENDCTNIATHWLELLYLTVYPPSETPLSFCDDHRAEVIGHFEGRIPNYALSGEEPIEIKRSGDDR